MKTPGWADLRFYIIARAILFGFFNSKRSNFHFHTSKLEVPTNI